MEVLKSLHLDYAEFYITNVCNLNCAGCNRYNNFNFTGQHKWETAEHRYRKWSEILDLDEYTILGGEPTINPQVGHWITQLSKLWPLAQGKVITNGTLFEKLDRRLYDALAQTQGQTYMDVDVHNPSHRDWIVESTLNYLEGPVVETKKLLPILHDVHLRRSYKKVKDPQWPDISSVAEWNQLPEWIQQECEQKHNVSPELVAVGAMKHSVYEDANGVLVRFVDDLEFHQANIIPKADGTFDVYDSDPELAHDICYNRTCHHFEDGYLSKCGQVALLPKFAKQYNVNLSHKQQALLADHIPADPSWPIDTLKEYINNLQNSIPQCSLCPSEYVWAPNLADIGNKPKMPKRTD